MYQPSIIDDYIFFDASSAVGINYEAQEAIDRCRDLGFEDSQIFIDMLISEKAIKTKHQWDSGSKSYENFMHGRTIRND